MNEAQYAMTAPEPSAFLANSLIGEPVEDAPGMVDVETRFGKIRVRTDHPVVFTKGLLGMPEKRNFCLTQFPVEKFSQFKLLQSLDDNDLSFITLPVDFDNDIITRSDLEEGCKDLAMTPAQISLLLIVSVHRDVDQVRLSVNARAPLFIDVEKRVAEQYVLRNNNYLVRHMLSVGDDAGAGSH